MDMLWTVTLGLVVLGLTMGSFVGAQVWRLRARQLVEDKAAGEDYDKPQLKQLEPIIRQQQSHRDRSRCLKCGHQLHAVDLVPLLSWLSTGGRCRYCKKAIGSSEPLLEVSLMGLFVGSYWLWPLPLSSPLEWAIFAVWLVALVLLAIQFVYDARWFLLPDQITFMLIAVAAVFAGMVMIHAEISWPAVLSLLGAIAILSGIYALLYIYSRGRWIGFGDVKLGIALALLVGRWELALLALFLANLLGTLLVLPSLALGRLNRQSQVPFGPMLIVATVITVLVGQRLIDWYMQASLRLFM